MRSRDELTQTRHDRPASDRYDRHQSGKWLADHGLTPTPRPAARWLLSAPRPASFAQAVELGAIDINDLAVPVCAADSIGGGS